MSTSNFHFEYQKPPEALAEFVESFWMLENRSDQGKEIVILPDGRMDLTLSRSATEPFNIVLSGLETLPQPVVLEAHTRIFAISFRLLAVEYLVRRSISQLLNYAIHMPEAYWDFKEDDLLDFGKFCEKASQKIQEHWPKELDPRKQKLFGLLYAKQGEIPVKELSEQAAWSSRQINRYFNDRFGLSVKSYANILRFRASLQHIKEGKLFPQQNFADQSHFIKEVKKLSGALPKELRQNQNDRFIQFSVLPPA